MVFCSVMKTIIEYKQKTPTLFPWAFFVCVDLYENGYRTFSPRISRMSTIIMARTRRRWIKPPMVYELTMPRSHNRIRMMAIVISIIHVVKLSDNRLNGAAHHS